MYKYKQGPVSERVAINRKFYTSFYWATIDIHRTINRNPLWNGAQGASKNTYIGLKIITFMCFVHTESTLKYGIRISCYGLNLSLFFAWKLAFLYRFMSKSEMLATLYLPRDFWE